MPNASQKHFFYNFEYIGNICFSFRKAYSLSLEELSAQTTIPKRALGSFERGNDCLQATELLILFDALCIPIELTFIPLGTGEYPEHIPGTLLFKDPNIHKIVYDALSPRLLTKQ